MMIDATVAPKVGFISPFGTTACNVNHINARRQAPPMAEATQERRLEAVRCSLVLGALAWASNVTPPPFYSLVRPASPPTLGLPRRYVLRNHCAKASTC